MSNAKPPALNSRRGMLVVSLLAVACALLLLGLGLVESATSKYSQAHRELADTNAQLASEAGVERTLKELNNDDTFSGFKREQVFFENPHQGKGVYKTAVSDISGSDARTITSVGKTYKNGHERAPLATRTVKVTVAGTGSQGYSVQAGSGGLILSGSAVITNSQVYSNGGIKLSGSAKIGTFDQPLDVKVANQSCATISSLADSSSAVCPRSNAQPISLDWSSGIFGTVCATGQTTTGPNRNITGGMSGQGLVSSCAAPPIDFPAHDRNAQIAAANTDASADDSKYTCKSLSDYEKTWPAGLRLNGDVLLSGSCNITVKGDVYISGNLDISGAVRLTTADATGNHRPLIMVDGKITVGGSVRVAANRSGMGLHFASYKSSAACSPDCSDLSSNELKQSQALETVKINGALNLPAAIFEARFGKLSVSGSGSLGSVIGQTVDLSKAGTITFGTILSSGSRSWNVTSYQLVK